MKCFIYTKSRKIDLYSYLSGHTVRMIYSHRFLYLDCSDILKHDTDKCRYISERENVQHKRLRKKVQDLKSI